MLDGTDTVLRLRNHLDSRIKGQDCGKTHPDDGMVVGDEDADGFLWLQSD